MESKKDIGRAFRERLKDLDRSPSDDVWAKIEADLEKKKKRRGIFWLWWPGLLAALLIGYLGITYLGAPATKKGEKHDDPANSGKIYQQPAVSNSGGNSPDAGTVEGSRSQTTKELHNHHPSENSHQSAGVSSSRKFRETGRKRSRKYKSSRAAKGVAHYSSYFSKKRIAAIEHVFKESNETGGIVYQANPTGSLGRELMFSTTDSLSVAETPKDSTATKLKDKKEEPKTVEQPKPQYEFYLGAWYGPNRLSSFSGASPISDWNTYSGKGRGGTSFGVFAKWKFTGRLGIRIGYSQIKLSYQTMISGLGNDNQFLDSYRITLAEGLTSSDVEDKFVDSQTVRIDQEIRYTEIPITFSYQLYDGKFGADVLLGLALMRYSQNDLTASADGVAPFALGRQNNFLKTTSGIDVGFQAFYKLGSRWRLEVTPLFRYQVKTLQSDTTFRPWWITAEFGFSYRL